MFDKLKAGLDRTGLMKILLSFDIGSMGKFGSFEYTDVGIPTVYAYLSHPSICDSMNTEKPTGSVFIWPAPVLQVFGVRHISKVAESVVISNPVDVIYYPDRPTTCNVQPCKSVSTVRRRKNLYNNIPDRAPVGAFRTNFYTPTCANTPSKYSSFWIVMKNFAQTLCGKIGSSHDVVPFKQCCGEKPRRVDSTAGLRYFKLSLFGGQT